MTTLPITLTIAGASAVLNFWIGERVGMLRRRLKILIGDGGNEAVVARMRAHSNFIEYTPLFLILLALVELSRGSPAWLWVVAVLFVIGRIIHAFGMDRPGANALRIGGMVLTFLPTLVLAAYGFAIPYLDRNRPQTITYVEADAAASTRSATNGFVLRS